MPCLPQGRPGRGLLHSLAALALCCTLTPAATAATPPIIQTIAGIGVGDGGPAVGGLLDSPGAVLALADGSVLVGDMSMSRVRRVWPDGHITTFFGNGHHAYRGDGGQATAASFKNVSGLAQDAAGNVYASDADLGVVRKIAPNGIVSTVAGNVAGGTFSDGGPATEAYLWSPSAVACGPDGSLYIAEYWATTVRRVKDGIITTVTGDGSQASLMTDGTNTGDGGPAASATISRPNGLAVAPDGTLYIALGSANKVRAISPGGTISTVAGTGAQGKTGDGGPATQATLYRPSALALRSNGALLISDTANDRVRQVATDGTMSSFAGQNGVPSQSPWGDGGDADAMVFKPGAISVGGANVYVADGLYSSALRRIDASHVASTVASSWGRPIVDGQPATSGTLEQPETLAVAADGTVAVGEASASRVLTISPDGIVHETRGLVPPNSTVNDFSSATALRYAADGALWAFDPFFGRLLRLKDGTATHIAGSTANTASYADGIQAIDAKLSGVSDFLLEPGGTIVLCDNSRHRIRRIGTDGVIRTIAGTGTSGFSGDGGPATAAKIAYPEGLARLADGSILVADTENGRIRRIAPDGTISTFAGSANRASTNPGAQPTGDGGPATQAALFEPFAIAVASDGTVVFTDIGAARVRAVAPDGTISTLAGTGEYADDGDGGPATGASFRNLAGVAITPRDDVLVTDATMGVVRRFPLRATPDPVTSTPGSTGTGPNTPTPAITLALAFTPKAVKAKLGHVALVRLRGTAGTKATVTLRKGNRIVRTLKGTLSAKGRLTLRLPARRKGVSLAVGRYTLTARGTKGTATATATGTLTIKR